MHFQGCELSLPDPVDRLLRRLNIITHPFLFHGELVHRLKRVLFIGDRGFDVHAGKLVRIGKSFGVGTIEFL